MIKKALDRQYIVIESESNLFVIVRKGLKNNKGSLKTIKQNELKNCVGALKNISREKKAKNVFFKKKDKTILRYANDQKYPLK